MKKILLIILYVLGLTFSTQSMADVKNLPIICKYPDENLAQKVRDSYSLYNTEIEQMIKKLFENPELILKQGFIDHEARIKKLNLKCPGGAGAKMIKPYKEKDYRKDKFKINYKYISEMRKRTKKGLFSKTTSNKETPHIIFLIYLLSLNSDYNFEKYKINVERRCWNLDWERLEFKIWEQKAAPIKPYKRKDYEIDRALSSFGGFECLQYYFHKKQAEKNNRDYIELNYKIVELPSKKISGEELKKASLDIAFNNLPNICKSRTIYSTWGYEQIGLNLSKSTSLWGIKPNQRDVDNFHQIVAVLTKHPELFFTNDLGFRQLNCGTDIQTDWGQHTSKVTITPYDKKALEKGEYKLSKAYINNVKKLDSKDKENLKFLINLIMLNPNTALPVSVDETTKQKFKSNYAVLLGAYDELKNNETYRIVRTVSRTRLVLKILLALL